MSDDSARCSTCGLSESGWLDGLCPVCLLGLSDEASPPGLASASKSGNGPLRQMGDYELHEVLGRGGMGVVYRARQRSLDRWVAVKVLAGGNFANETFIQRFHREAQAAASLSHPHIVAIYEVGEHAGQPYFSMELIEGRNLAEVTHDQPPTVGQSVGLMRTLAAAIHVAHERGILHRDLKPSNVLMDQQGVPHITDFGVAKRLGDERDLTLTGQLLGSPNYMAPEQASGRSDSIGRGCDIYSLGAILYHLLTGRPPHLADTVPQTLRLAAETDPISPRLLNPSVSRDLETVCLKCLERSPASRYASAAEVAQELERVSRGEPITARPLGVFERGMRWCHRRPAMAVAAGAIAMLLLVVAVGSVLALMRIQRERDAAELAKQEESRLRARAEEAERTTQRQLYEALLGEARATVRSGELGQRFKTLEAIRRAGTLSNTVALRQQAMAALALPDVRLEGEFPLNPRNTFAQLDGGFNRIALAEGAQAVEIRRVADQRLLTSIPVRGEGLTVGGRWSPDGRFLALRRKPKGTSTPLTMEVWRVDPVRQLRESPATPYAAFAFHPLRSQLLADSGSNTVSLRDLESDAVITQYSVPGIIHHLELSPDGRQFVVQHRSDRPWFTSLYDVASGKVLASRITIWMDSIAWDPKDRWIAFGGRNGEVHLYHRKTGGVEVIGRLRNAARSAAFSPEGTHLLVGTDEREVGCWDLRTMRRVLTLPLRGTGMQFQADGHRWAALTRAGVSLYTTEFSTLQREIAGDVGYRLRYAALSSDGRWLAASGLSRLGVWDLETESAPAFPLDDEHLRPAFSPDGTELCAFSPRKFARWRLPSSARGVTTCPQLVPLPVPEIKRVFSAEYTADRLVLGTDQGGLTLPRTGRTVAGAASPFLGFVMGAVSPNGDLFAARRLGTVDIYGLVDWRKRGALELNGELLAHAFAPDGRSLAVASRSGLLCFDSQSWTLQRRMEVFLSEASDLYFEPDGRSFWLVRDALEASLHDFQTFETLMSLPAGRVPRALSADGRRLAVTVDSQRLEVWDLMKLRESLRDLGVDWAGR